MQCAYNQSLTDALHLQPPKVLPTVLPSIEHSSLFQPGTHFDGCLEIDIVDCLQKGIEQQCCLGQMNISRWWWTRGLHGRPHTKTQWPSHPACSGWLQFMGSAVMESWFLHRSSGLYYHVFHRLILIQWQSYIHTLAATHLNISSTFPKQDAAKVQKVCAEVSQLVSHITHFADIFHLG